MTAREQALQDMKDEQVSYGDCVKQHINDDDYVRPSHLRNRDIRFGFNQENNF